MAVKIERAYGKIGEIGWSYEARDDTDDSLIIEGYKLAKSITTTS